MKIRLIAFSFLASSITAYSQGTVVFNNSAGTLRAPILIAPAHPLTQLQGQPNAAIALAQPLGTTDYGPGATGASGTGFSAELWAGADAASLSIVTGSRSPLRTGTFAGYVTQIGTLPISQIVPGASGTMQIRAWDNANNTITTWAQAVGGNLGRGQSAPFVNATGGAGDPASSPASLTMSAFNIYVVPEPSLIALGALGLGALLLRRRKA